MSLSTLPFELLAQVFRFLNPVDILAIRATCKVLSEATFERLIWHQAFTEILDWHAAIHPSDELESMTREDLEFAALRPARFVQSVLASEEELAPIATVDIDYATPPFGDVAPDMENPRFSEAFMVVGGRFLITVFMRRLVSLWSLQDIPGQSEQVQLLASIEPAANLRLANPTEWLLWIHQIYYAPEDRETVRIVIYLSSADAPPGSQIYIYDIRPCSDEPAFHLFLRGFNPRFAYDDLQAFDGNYMVFIDDYGTVTVWNLSLDSSISWQLETTELPTAGAIKDSKLLLFYDLIYVKIFDIPESAFGGSKRLKLLPFFPSYSLNGIEPAEVDDPDTTDYHLNRTYYMSQPCSAAEPLTMVAYNQDERESVPPWPGLQVFVVEPIQGNGVGRFDESILRKQGSIASITGRIDFTCGVFIGESYAVLWREEVGNSPTILLGVLAPFGPRAPETTMRRNTAKIAQLSAGSTVSMFDFCPVSTRLVTLADGKVQIMQFN